MRVAGRAEAPREPSRAACGDVVRVWPGGTCSARSRAAYFLRRDDHTPRTATVHYAARAVRMRTPPRAHALERPPAAVPPEQPASLRCGLHAVAVRSGSCHRRRHADHADVDRTAPRQELTAAAAPRACAARQGPPAHASAPCFADARTRPQRRRVRVEGVSAWSTCGPGGRHAPQPRVRRPSPSVLVGVVVHQMLLVAAMPGRDE